MKLRRRFGPSDAVRAVAALACLVGQPSDALAFTTASSQTTACHEPITVRAGLTAGWPGGVAAPPLDDLGQRISDDSFFPLPEDAQDLWTLALVAGVRHVDIVGHRVSDLPAIAAEAADPQKQDDHCLRAASHDGPAGDAAAISGCRGFILHHVELAIGPGDTIDMSATVIAKTTLVFRGPTDLTLNRYAFHMGMALHAVQDGFSHTLRAPEDDRVSHVLNYIDFVSSDYDPARDGHRHLAQLDGCDDDVPEQARRRDKATQASAELLAATADDTGGREGRMARVQVVLDRWFTVKPNCTIDNDYCDAAELSEAAPGCDLGGAEPGPWWLLGVAAILGVHRLRRRRAASFAGLLGLFSFLTLGTAEAQTAAPSASAPPPQPLVPGPAPPGEAPAEKAERKAEEREIAAEVAEPGKTVVSVDTVKNEVDVVERKTVDAADEGEPVNRGFGLFVGGGASLDEASLMVTGGLRFDLTHWLTLGIDGEYNPWFSIDAGHSSTGTTNVYVPVIFTWASTGPLEFRSTLSGGISILNFDLVGADQGSVGPFVSTAPIGVAIRAARWVRVVVDPGGLAFSVPQTAGIPLIVRQHRVSLGLHFMPGW